MAIFHLSAKVMSRSQGRSAVAAAAYRHAVYLRDDRTGEAFDFRRKRGVDRSEILAPIGAPEWMRDRSKLWNGVEGAEHRRDAQLAREIEVSIPRELSRDEAWSTIRDFVNEQFVSRGMVADIAIHKVRSSESSEAFDGFDRHTHIMLTLRRLTPDGFEPKERAWNDRDLLRRHERHSPSERRTVADSCLQFDEHWMKAEVSEYPINVRRGRLSAFNSERWPDLSARALRGFYSRATEEKTRLRYPAGFLESLRKRLDVIG